MAEYEHNLDGDIEFSPVIEISSSALWDILLSDQSGLDRLAVIMRNYQVGPMARRMGNTADKTAQKKTPLASSPQVPGTQRIN